MKKIILCSSLLLISSYTHAKCNTMAIGVYKETGFGLSFGGGKSSAGFYDKHNVNVPLSIDGRQACFREVTAFKMKSEKKGNKPMQSSISITPMKTEFENVPSPHQKQYIFVEKNEADRNLTKFHVLSYVCSGELPLSIAAVSDSVQDLENKKDDVEVKISTVFATGVAAANLKDYLSSKASSIDTYNFFTKLYKEKTIKEIDNYTPCCGPVKVPSILTGTSINALAGVERKIASTFTTMTDSVPNGCSSEFAETMKEYQLENYSSNESLKGYKVKKGWISSDIKFEW